MDIEDITVTLDDPLSLMDMPDEVLRTIFEMAEISGMARFVCPRLKTLFCDSKTIRASEIKNKGLDLVKWACDEGMFADAATHKHVSLITTPEIVEWYIEKFNYDKSYAYKLMTTPEILEWAIAGGMERQYMFYLRHSYGPTESDFLMAAKHGHLEVVKWGHMKRFNFPQFHSLCNKAADGGQLHVLKWARSVNPPYAWGTETTEFAAISGHLHVLKWLRENGCPWNAYTIEAAIRQGHLEIAEWARENGCPTEIPGFPILN